MRKGFIDNLLLMAGLLIAAWLAGFFLFVGAVEKRGDAPPPDKTAAADAIVVLTGGSERITFGLELLRADKGKQLLISGAHPGVSLEKLLGKEKVAKKLATRITLGHAADTIENASETRAFMEAGHFRSMLLVTSNYHMLRSLLELRAAMPGVTITPCPVAPEQVRLAEWWWHPGTAALLMTEYVKYLAAALRVRLEAP